MTKDIYQRILEDHEEQRDLMKKISETQGDFETRKKLFSEFQQVHDAHIAAEERTFYKEMIARSEGQDEARHGVHEHFEASQIMEELTDMDVSEQGWLQRFATLREKVEHHFEEEEGMVFDQAREMFSRSEEEKIGQAFSREKAKELRGDEAA